MKYINKDRPLFDDQSKVPKADKMNPTEDSENDIVDPLEVVIEEEQDEKAEEDTQDDMFDDDELDLDPTLDKDEW